MKINWTNSDAVESKKTTDYITSRTDFNCSTNAWRARVAFCWVKTTRPAICIRIRSAPFELLLALIFANLPSPDEHRQHPDWSMLISSIEESRSRLGNALDLVNLRSCSSALPKNSCAKKTRSHFVIRRAEKRGNLFFVVRTLRAPVAGNRYVSSVDEQRLADGQCDSLLWLLPSCI